MTDFAWLIEAPGPFYLEARKLSIYEFHWTADPHKALRFYNAEQADLTMMAVREAHPALFLFAGNLRDARAVEHGFMRADT